jgi:hypothetical protein
VLNLVRDRGRRDGFFQAVTMLQEMAQNQPERNVHEMLDSIAKAMHNPDGGWPWAYMLDVSTGS